MANVSGENMKTKTKNILTALVLGLIAFGVYAFAVVKAISQ
jgi:hypothetical protein